MQTVSFQVSDSVKKKLDHFAKKLDRSKGYLMRQAVEEYLEDLEDFIEAQAYKKTYDPSENVSLATLKKKHKLG